MMRQYVATLIADGWFEAPGCSPAARLKYCIGPSTVGPGMASPGGSFLPDNPQHGHPITIPLRKEHRVAD